jgi:hypothetical protein
VTPFPDTGALLVAISAVDGRLIVTGNGDGRPAAWLSDDGGASWQPADVGLSGSDLTESMGPLIEVDGRLISIGHRVTGENDADSTQVTWASSDGGMSWTPARLLDVAGVVSRITSGGPGLVAVGTADSDSGVPGVPLGAVWMSPDGDTWTRAPADPTFEGASLRGVAENNGLLIAVGLVLGDRILPGAWTSRDPLVWEPVSLPTEVGAASDVVADARGAFVAVGYETDGSTTRPMAWRSSDGLVWQQVPLEGEAPDMTAERVASGTHGFVAIGSSSSGYQPFVWYAAAGADHGSTQNVDRRLLDVVALDDTFIAIGDCGPSGDCSPTLITGRASTPTSPTVPSPTPPETPAPTSTLSDGPLISIPTQAPFVRDQNGVLFCNEALLSGRLVAHPQWGIAVEGGLVFWPNGYVGRIAGDRIELLDDKGRVVARTGDQIEAGGGQATINGLDGFAVCPGVSRVQPAEP